MPKGSEVRSLYRQHWSSIRQHFHRGRPVQDVYNFRLTQLNSLGSYLTAIFDDQPQAFRINYSFGYILRHKDTEQLRYFYGSTNNARVLDEPRHLDSRTALSALLTDVSAQDPLAWAQHQRPNTKWAVEMVTNVVFFVHKLPTQPMVGAGTVTLPDYLANNKGLHTLVCGKHGPYQDHLCLFRCLALHLHKADPRGCTDLAEGYLHTYLRAREMDRAQFRGVPLSALDTVETLFEVNIRVYELVPTDTCHTARLVHRSMDRYPTTLLLNLYEQHFSYIKDLSRYAKSYTCPLCKATFPNQTRLRRHAETCTTAIQRKYPGGVFRNQPTLFEELAEMGIYIPEAVDRFYPYRACYDFEAYLEPLDDDATTRTTWTSHHVPMSVSVNSNIPGHDYPVCFVSTGDPHELVQRMMAYLSTLSRASATLLTERYAVILNQLEERIDPEASTLSATAKLRDRFLAYIAQLPVLGFNSGNYDMNLIKQQLYPYLAKTGSVKYVIKRHHDHMALSTSDLRFLDIRNYLAPHYSYETWIRAYDCQAAKGKFCYAYVDSLARLQERQLPPRHAFDNDLTQEPCTEAEYAALQEVWTIYGMRTLKDLLIWYNNLDVVPFMEAAEKMAQFYRTMQVDVFKDCISVPGLTLRYLFHELPTVFSLVKEEDKDLHTCLKDNIVGGPSIIFHRYHERGVTRIRGGKLCQGIVGFDANALYLSCLASPMPTGHVVRWQRCGEHFKAAGTRYGLAERWLEWESYRRGVPIRHRLNHTEKRIGDRQLPVDGFAIIDGRPTVFQFYGCYWHCHGCHLNYTSQGEFRYHARRGLAPEDLQNEVHENEAYIESLGYQLVTMWECYFQALCRTEPDLQACLQALPLPPAQRRRQTQAQLLDAIQQDRLFGFVECDIHVPEALKPVFAECPPIFKNTTVSRDDIGPTMAAFAQANDLLTQPRRMLIGSMFGEKILLGTPLIRWYVAHGLVITHIYQVMEYTPDTPFRAFADRVTEARRQGDADPSKALIGETMKLLGNSGYGKTITNQDRHVEVKICDVKKTRKLLNSVRCRTVEQIDDETYEVTSAKKTIRYNLPLQIGCMVYQYAKLRMLEFYYDFIARFFDPSDWQYCEMDTDSAYMAWSDPDWESLVKPELRRLYEAERDRWLPRREHYAFDKRTPGLFKVEWAGDAIVCLSSKTYYCYGGESQSKDKISCKGVSARNITKDTYLSVLRHHQSASGINRGMRMRGNTMYSYIQQKDAFTYFYGKRKVLSDGVSTTYLDV